MVLRRCRDRIPTSAIAGTAQAAMRSIASDTSAATIDRGIRPGPGRIYDREPETLAGREAQD